MSEDERFQVRLDQALALVDAGRRSEAVPVLRDLLLDAPTGSAEQLLRGFLATWAEPNEAYANAYQFLLHDNESHRAWRKLQVAAERSGRAVVAIFAARLAERYRDPAGSRASPFVRVPPFGQFP